LILLILLPPIVFFRDFYKHFYVYLTGNIITNLITQQWHIVVLSILLFVAFLVPLSFRRKANWAERGLVTAFFISLFIEMYGIPLTILFASKYFITTNVNAPDHLIKFNFLGVCIGMTMAMSYGALLIIIGALLVIIGWITLYRNVKKKGLVTNGIYRYSRHPQYLGFILVIIGWFIGWPTILTLVFTPILIYRYIRLCKTEEYEIQNKFPEYKDYKTSVSLFI